MQYLQNLASLIDPNFYFFANHPNERVGINEQDRFWFGFLPLFIIGMLLLGQKRWFVCSLAVVLIVAVWLGVEVGSQLLYPFIAIAIARGGFWVVGKVRNNYVDFSKK